MKYFIIVIILIALVAILLPEKNVPTILTGESVMTTSIYDIDSELEPKIFQIAIVSSMECWETKIRSSIYKTHPGDNWIPEEVLTYFKSSSKFYKKKQLPDLYFDLFSRVPVATSTPPRLTMDGTLVTINCSKIKSSK